MSNVNQTDETQLPSSIQLMKSTAIAAVAAMLLLIVIVMPAEYGIDPTGIGSVTGLKRMGEIKVLLAEEAEQNELALLSVIDAQSQNPAISEALIENSIVNVSSSPVPTAQEPQSVNGERSDVMQITLTPNASTEIKVALAKGKTVQFSWESNGGAVNFDTHGDSEALDISYFSYGKGTEQSDSGVIEAAFDGNHGWYWRNRSDASVTITLSTNGEYTDIKQLH